MFKHMLWPTFWCVIGPRVITYVCTMRNSHRKLHIYFVTIMHQSRNVLLLTFLIDNKMLTHQPVPSFWQIEESCDGIQLRPHPCLPIWNPWVTSMMMATWFVNISLQERWCRQIGKWMAAPSTPFALCFMRTYTRGQLCSRCWSWRDLQNGAFSFCRRWRLWPSIM